MDAQPRLRYWDRMFNRSTRSRGAIYCLLLILTTLMAYWQVRHYDFTSYDDEDYVTRNPMVQQGLTPASLRWAATTTHFSYWHPLTWTSHMLDCQLFGLDAGMHHLTNVLLHILATLTLFFCLTSLTGALERSAFVAALFALHPLHVESVAWVAERKDVLSTLFWFLTMWAYGWYAQKPSAKRYWLSLGIFLCGLMSKPMLVTVPCVLLLLDFWPLRRLTLTPRLEDGEATGWRGYWWALNRQSRVPISRLLLEKVPFLFLALASSTITVVGVYVTNRVVGNETFPLGLRLANVPISYVRYIAKMIMPENMVILYPMPDDWPAWMVIGSTLFLLLVSSVVVLLIRRAPYLLVGWLWYLGTLVPTIGLIPVGWQSIADRYTYVPLVGLFIMVTWSAADLLRHWPYRRPVFIAATSIILAGFTLGTWFQTRHWRNSETLYRHAVNVSTNNEIAQYNLALTLQLKGDWNGAAQHYREAIRIKPNKDKSYNNLGNLYNALGRYSEATNWLWRALELNSQNESAHLNLGRSMFFLEAPEQALRHYEEAVRLKPNFQEAHLEKGWALIQMGRIREALSYYESTLAAHPDFHEVQAQLAWVLATVPAPEFRDGQRAVALATDAVQLTAEQNPWPLLVLGAAQAETGNFVQAVTSIHQAKTMAQMKRDFALEARCDQVLVALEKGQPYREESTRGSAAP